MYACICNGIKDSQVRDAAQRGAGTVGQVFRSLDCKPNCATCVQTIRNLLEEELLPENTLIAAE
ncbi:(2Fe-2S)-binding protein [Sneathiella limimaris]|uniref:(2Fe-2S)-binding protein n=1 Tax=Sneathiella limimaris TaxID=1964213 RepID=UPI00146E7C88|nr:(2Fe-2S)-binding protein [Sneathiella limimaris]